MLSACNRYQIADLYAFLDNKLVNSISPEEALSFFQGDNSLDQLLVRLI